MMFASGVELDVADDHHLRSFIFEYGLTRSCERIHPVSLRHVEQGFGGPDRGLHQPFARRVFTDEAQNRFIVGSDLRHKFGIMFIFGGH